jgi:amino acid transporter
MGTASPSKSMNIWSVTAMGIGAMVGAGIFALLGVVTQSAGDETYISFLFGGGIGVLSGYSYAKLSARFPDSGGLSEFFIKAFGAGATSGALSLIFLVTLAATIAMVAKAFGAYATPLIFGNTNPLLIDAFASAITVVLVLLNFGGSEFVGKTEIALVGVKLTILGILIVAGMYGMTTHSPIERPAPHLLSVIGSVAVTMLAFAGYGMMPNAAGSVQHPRTTIPLSIYLAIGIVTLIYVALSIVVVANVPIVEFSHNPNTVVAIAARPLLGETGYAVVSVTALLATASCINAWIFTTMQISSTMAEVGQLPRMFGRLIWRKGSLGLSLGVAAILLVINVFDLTALAGIASAAFILTHMSVQVAHWRLIHETNGSRVLVAAGFLSMAFVLAVFLWTTAFTQPWSIGLIALFVAGSWMAEWFLFRSRGAASKPGSE